MYFYEYRDHYQWSLSLLSVALLSQKAEPHSYVSVLSCKQCYKHMADICFVTDKDLESNQKQK